MNIQEQLSQFGVADAIVFLNTPLPSATIDSGAAAFFVRAIRERLADQFLEPDIDEVNAVSHSPSIERRRLFESADTSTPVDVQIELPRVRSYPNLGILYGRVDKASFERMKADSSVKDITAPPELSLIRPTESAVEQDVQPDSLANWGLSRLNVPELWSQGITGNGVLVGHLDTGVDGGHPAMQGAIAAFAEFDASGSQVPGAAAYDSGSHGTHTAGTICGRDVDGMSFGVAPGAMLVSAMVIEGGRVRERILGGMDWAIGQGIRVLNMSLGFRGYDPAFLQLTQILRARGVFPVFAVGNEGPNTSRSPGNYQEVLSIGSCSQNDDVSYFSSSQAFQQYADPVVPRILAPGEEIYSSLPGGTFGTLSGTSMATPHIAGLVALLMEARPGKSIDDIEAAIISSCSLPPAISRTRGNHGIPDAVKALSLL